MARYVLAWAMPSWVSVSSRRPWRATRKPCAMHTTTTTRCWSAESAAVWEISTSSLRYSKSCFSDKRFLFSHHYILLSFNKNERLPINKCKNRTYFGCSKRLRCVIWVKHSLDCTCDSTINDFASVFTEYDNTAEHLSQHHQCLACVVLGIVKQELSELAGWCVFFFFFVVPLTSEICICNPLASQRGLVSMG